MNKRQIKRNFDEQLAVISTNDQTKSDKKRRWRRNSETRHKSEPQNLKNGKDSSLEVKVVAVHSSKKENLKDGSPPRVRNWRYNRVWRRDRVWVKRDTPRQNETLLATKALDKHRTEKILTRGVVQGRLLKETWRRDDEQHAKFKHGLPPAVPNWRYNRVWRSDRVWMKEKTVQQMAASSAAKSPETPSIDKNSPIPSATSSSTKVDISRTDMEAASQHLDKHVTPSVHPPPSVSVSPTQTCSVSPSEDSLSVATVERRRTNVICSGKETTTASHDSSSAPCDQMEQPIKTAETELACGETKPQTTTGEKMVRKSLKRTRPSVRNTPNKRFMLRAPADDPADDTGETSARTRFLWSFETKAEQLCLAYEDLCLR